MNLSKQNIKNISPQRDLAIPDEKIFSLPEKILQFGTGVLLRGLPDYFIDKANRQGIFNGRIVVVKSTDSGGADAFDRQDGLYTLCIRGVENNIKVEETIINSSISRVLSAKNDWRKILDCAHNPELRIVISNTTEVGITLSDDDIHLSPPASFPGKLLAFLYERYKIFNGSDESGMVIVPTELITDNGSKLYSVIIELARINKLDEKFIQWIKTSNHFCNSLVDRIVPGKLQAADKASVEKKLGYTDELMIMAESFSLWAIESGSEKVKTVLSFSKVNEGVVITPDIEKFRELKLRLLNGTHTFVCGLACLCGFKTVREAMSNEQFLSFVHHLMINEIAETIADDTLSYEDACNFAMKVIDRFRNPYIEHLWASIAVQYSSKMRMRNVPLLLKHYNKTNEPPELMILGFAAYILFMKAEANGVKYNVQDDHADYFAAKWKTNNENEMIDSILSDKNLWGVDLSKLNGFSERIKYYLDSLQQNGAIQTIKKLELQKSEV